MPKGQDVHLVVDMRQPNKAILRSHYPVPTIDELIEEFNGCVKFSKIDFNHGYHQLGLDPESRELTTFSTHSGLYRYTRLVQGASSALEDYQYIIGSLFREYKGIANISDDILIGGRDNEEHDRNLNKCLMILQENNLTVNPSKCLIGVPEVTFFGLKISANGISPTSDKIDIIKHFPQPTTTKQLSSFLGMVTYLAGFIPNLATESEPLRKLLRVGTEWEWGEEQRVTFNKLKDLVSSDSVMAHFDCKLNTSLVVDAGPVGLGAILLQKQNDGTLRPVRYASRTLTSQERKYSQTEKEALAVVWACERFHIYLFGCHFTILTDHQPLTILYNSAGKPSPRILRWSLRLQSYNYTIQHIPGKINPADFLSICPLPIDKTTETVSEELEQYINAVIAYSVPKATTLSEIIDESGKDDQIKKVVTCIKTNDWPKYDADVRSYYPVRNELTTKGGILLRGECLVIPLKLRDNVLKIAHESHQGIVKTKSMVREKVWWPGINSQIEEMIKTCVACQSMSKVIPQPMQSYTMIAPWHQVHIDICGPFPSNDYLLGIIDANTRWPDIHVIRSTTSSTVKKYINQTFATHGYPSVIVTDNAPNLVSVEIKDYCEQNGIEHKSSIPYWPQGNAEIERFYQTIGKAIKTMNAEGRRWQDDIYRFLLDYRTTPHCSTNASPASLLMNRRLRTKLPTVSPKVSAEFSKAKKRDVEQKKNSKQRYDRKKRVKQSQIKVGDLVIVKQKKENKLTTNFSTKPHKVVKVDGAALTLRYNNKEYTRNVAHVKRVDPSRYLQFSDFEDSNVSYSTTGDTSEAESEEYVEEQSSSDSDVAPAAAQPLSPQMGPGGRLWCNVDPVNIVAEPRRH